MIGSKRKIKLIYEDLIARGISAETLSKVHAPLGFAIGSQTVPEIAVSIVAELIACRNLGRTIPEARVQVMAENGVIVRQIPDAGVMRASVGAWSNEDDLERLLALAA